LLAAVFLAEFHLQEITRLLAANTLSRWLTTQMVWKELAEKAVRDRAKTAQQLYNEGRPWRILRGRGQDRGRAQNGFTA